MRHKEFLRRIRASFIGDFTIWNRFKAALPSFIFNKAPTPQNAFLQYVNKFDKDNALVQGNGAAATQQQSAVNTSKRNLALDVAELMHMQNMHYSLANIQRKCRDITKEYFSGYKICSALATQFGDSFTLPPDVFTNHDCAKLYEYNAHKMALLENEKFKSRMQCAHEDVRADLYAVLGDIGSFVGIPAGGTTSEHWERRLRNDISNLLDGTAISRPRHALFKQYYSMQYALKLSGEEALSHGCAAKARSVLEKLEGYVHQYEEQYRVAFGHMADVELQAMHHLGSCACPNNESAKAFLEPLLKQQREWDVEGEGDIQESLRLMQAAQGQIALLSDVANGLHAFKQDGMPLQLSNKSDNDAILDVTSKWFAFIDQLDRYVSYEVSALRLARGTDAMHNSLARFDGVFPQDGPFPGAWVARARDCIEHEGIVDLKRCFASAGKSCGAHYGEQKVDQVSPLHAMVLQELLAQRRSSDATAEPNANQSYAMRWLVTEIAHSVTQDQRNVIKKVMLNATDGNPIPLVVLANRAGGVYRDVVDLFAGGSASVNDVYAGSVASGESVHRDIAFESDSLSAVVKEQGRAYANILPRMALSGAQSSEHVNVLCAKMHCGGTRDVLQTIIHTNCTQAVGGIAMFVKTLLQNVHLDKKRDFSAPSDEARTLLRFLLNETRVSNNVCYNLITRALLDSECVNAGLSYQYLHERGLVDEGVMEHLFNEAMAARSPSAYNLISAVGPEHWKQYVARYISKCLSGDVSCIRNLAHFKQVHAYCKIASDIGDGDINTEARGHLQQLSDVLAAARDMLKCDKYDRVIAAYITHIIPYNGGMCSADASQFDDVCSEFNDEIKQLAVGDLQGALSRGAITAEQHDFLTKLSCAVNASADAMMTNQYQALVVNDHIKATHIKHAFAPMQSSVGDILSVLRYDLAEARLTIRHASVVAGHEHVDDIESQEGITVDVASSTPNALLNADVTITATDTLLDAEQIAPEAYNALLDECIKQHMASGTLIDFIDYVIMSVHNGMGGTALQDAAVPKVLQLLTNVNEVLHIIQHNDAALSKLHTAIEVGLTSAFFQAAARAGKNDKAKSVVILDSILECAITYNVIFSTPGIRDKLAPRSCAFPYSERLSKIIKRGIGSVMEALGNDDDALITSRYSSNKDNLVKIFELLLCNADQNKKDAIHLIPVDIDMNREVKKRWSVVHCDLDVILSSQSTVKNLAKNVIDPLQILQNNEASTKACDAARASVLDVGEPKTDNVPLSALTLRQMIAKHLQAERPDKKPLCKLLSEIGVEMVKNRADHRMPYITERGNMFSWPVHIASVKVSPENAQNSIDVWREYSERVFHRTNSGTRLTILKQIAESLNTDSYYTATVHDLHNSSGRSQKLLAMLMPCVPGARANTHDFYATTKGSVMSHSPLYAASACGNVAMVHFLLGKISKIRTRYQHDLLFSSCKLNPEKQNNDKCIFKPTVTDNLLRLVCTNNDLTTLNHMIKSISNFGAWCNMLGFNAVPVHYAGFYAGAAASKIYDANSGMMRAILVAPVLSALEGGKQDELQSALKMQEKLVNFVIALSCVAANATDKHVQYDFNAIFQMHTKIIQEVIELRSAAVATAKAGNAAVLQQCDGLLAQLTRCIDDMHCANNKQVVDAPRARLGWGARIVMFIKKLFGIGRMAGSDVLHSSVVKTVVASGLASAQGAFDEVVKSGCIDVASCNNVLTSLLRVCRRDIVVSWCVELLNNEVTCANMQYMLHDQSSILHGLEADVQRVVEKNIATATPLEEHTRVEERRRVSSAADERGTSSTPPHPLSPPPLSPPSQLHSATLAGVISSRASLGAIKPDKAPISSRGSRASLGAIKPDKAPILDLLRPQAQSYR